MNTNPISHHSLKDENGKPLVDFGKFCISVADQAIKLANTIPEHMSTLTEQTIDAKEALSEACEGIGRNVEALKPLKKEMIDELRGLRMTTTTEVAAILKPMEDLRKFFLGDDHQKEVDRLKEFVELCERLETLKKSGFLDTVADTLLKLS